MATRCKGETIVWKGWVEKRGTNRWYQCRNGKQIKERITEIQEEIGKVAQTYHREILEIVNKFGGDKTHLNGSGRKKFWNLLKRKYPKCWPNGHHTFPLVKKIEQETLLPIMKD